MDDGSHADLINCCVFRKSPLIPNSSRHFPSRYQRGQPRRRFITQTFHCIPSRLNERRMMVCPLTKVYFKTGESILLYILLVFGNKRDKAYCVRLHYVGRT